MTKPASRIRALGEIAIRCRNIDVMAEFYGNVIGLEQLEGGHRPDIRFFKIAEGYGGHTAVLALFATQDTGMSGRGEGSSLHHFALSVERTDQDALAEYFQQSGIAYRIEEFGWIGWRGIFISDPEDNTVEFVAYDRAVTASK